jgi:hypothetical protein
MIGCWSSIFGVSIVLVSIGIQRLRICPRSVKDKRLDHGVPGYTHGYSILAVIGPALKNFDLNY